MNRILIFIFSITIILSPLSGQNEINYVSTNNEINEFMLSGEYADALPLLLNLEKAGWKNGNVEYKIGTCYLNTPGSEELAISYLKRAITDIAPNYVEDNGEEIKAPIQAYLLLGDAYRISNQIEDARKEYQLYLSKLNPNESNSTLLGKKRISECTFAKILMKNPIQAKFINLGPLINTGLANLNGCISGDGQTLVFTRKMKFYDAIFICKRVGDEWSKPQEITTKLGSDGEFYPTSLSYDGIHMLLTSYGFLTGYDIFESSMVNGRWTKVKKLNFQVSTQYNDLDAVYSPDGQTIYFASNRESGLGGYDIYKSTKDELGNWSFVENLGPPVNTSMDERSPSVFNDGKILVFSSNAEPSMGSYDFFYAQRDSISGKYTKVYNVGFPINSSGEDLGIKFVNKPGEGIFAKHDTKGYTNSDLFLIKFDDFSKFHLIPVNGVVTENGKKLSNPHEYVISIIDKNIKDSIQVSQLNEEGTFSVNLYPGDFIWNIKGNDVEQSQEIIIPQEIENNQFIVTANLSINKQELKQIAENGPIEEKPTINKEIPGKIDENASAITKQVIGITLTDTCFYTDILFEFNQFTISEKYRSMLIELISKLKKYNVNRITMIGYTDAIGKQEYNYRLSDFRAKEVRRFLLGHGIAEGLLLTEGLGGTHFVAINKNHDGSDNPLGRSFNRRVELIITSKDTKLVWVRKNTVPTELKCN